MNQDPFKKEQLVRSKLDEYHVEVPDFPMKRNKWERVINYLASPANNPIEPFISSSGVILLKVLPIAGTIVISLIQILFWL